MNKLDEYLEYLRNDKAVRYSDPTNAVVQAERLRIADELEGIIRAPEPTPTQPERSGDVADAARYRWLKDRSLRKSVMDSAKQNGPFIAVGSPMSGFHVPIKMDEAIDAAMLANGARPGEE